MKKYVLLLSVVMILFLFMSCSKEYSVNFVVDNKIIATEKVKNGNKASIPTSPTKEGYTFVEWQLDNEKYDFSTIVKEDINLNATFTINEYVVTFDSNGGSNVASQTIKYNEKATYPTAPTKEGYDFSCWQDASGNVYSFENPVTDNLNLVASWTPKEAIRYTITLDLDGGSFGSCELMTSFDVEEGTILSLTTPYKNGYNFLGWATTDGTLYTSSPVTSNLNLIALWEKGVYQATWLPNQQTNNWQGMGMEVVILVEKPSEVDPFDENYPFTDKDLKQKQQRLVEAAYGIIIKYEAYPDKAAWGPNRYNYIKQEYALGEFQNNNRYIINISSSWIPTLVKAGCLAELGTLSGSGIVESGILTEIGYSQKEEGSGEFVDGVYNIDSTKNQILSRNNKVYGYTSKNLRPDYFMYYNADLIANAGMSDPAELWLKGEWTWSSFEEYCDKLQAALASTYGTGYYSLTNGFAEFVIGSVAAEGAYIIDSTPRLALTSQAVISKFIQIQTLYASGTYNPSRGIEDVSLAFTTGNAAITNGSLWYLDNENRFPNDLNFEIGVVPYPTADGEGGKTITTENLSEAILGYDDEPIETEAGSGKYIAGVDMSESTFRVPVTEISCYSILDIEDGTNGINNKILFAILYDLTVNIVEGQSSMASEYQIDKDNDNDYRNWLETKFDHELYVEVIMSVQNQCYYEMIEVLNGIVTAGTDTYPRSFWYVANKICKDATVSVSEELNQILNYYQDALFPNAIITIE